MAKDHKSMGQAKGPMNRHKEMAMGQKIPVMKKGGEVKSCMKKGGKVEGKKKDK